MSFLNMLLGLILIVPWLASAQSYNASSVMLNVKNSRRSLIDLIGRLPQSDKYVYRVLTLYGK